MITNKLLTTMLVLPFTFSVSAQSIEGGEMKIQSKAAMSCVAVAKNGVIAVEAEHFLSQSKSKKRKWHVFDKNNTSGPKPDKDGSHHSSASDGGYLEILPDTRVTHSDRIIRGENFSDKPGELTIVNYRVQFPSAGKYFVFVRAYSTGSEDNGVHVGLNGKWPNSGKKMQWCTGKQKWTWESRQRTDANHCGEERRIFLNVPSAGVHTVSFSLREDGFEMDKFILSKKFRKPSGQGPAEILRNCNSRKAIVDNDAIEDNTSFVVYPSPANNIITIQGLEKVQKITVHNTLGKVVRVMEIKNEVKQQEMDIRDLPRGMYFVKTLDFESTMKQLKFIKN